MIRHGTRRFLLLAAWLWLSCLPCAFARPVLASLPSPEWSNPADYASTTSPLKNRVGGSEEWASGRFSPGDGQTLEIATGSNGCEYENASGRRKWLNRDPIGELGGINLYGFCNNDPVNEVDPEGFTGANDVFTVSFPIPASMRPPPPPRKKPCPDQLQAWRPARDPGFYNSLVDPKWWGTETGEQLADQTGTQIMTAPGGELMLASIWAKFKWLFTPTIEPTAPTVGQTVYRVYGGDSAAGGASWTPVNPAMVSNFRDVAGLPSGGASGANNTGRFVIEGILEDPSAVVKVRNALPLHGQAGGLKEYIIPNWQKTGAVRPTRVSGVNPEF